MDLEALDYDIDPQDLTIREVELVEDIIGAPITHLFSGEVGLGKASRALAFVVARRTYPEVKPEDLDDLTFSVANGAQREAEKTDPPEPPSS